MSGIRLTREGDFYWRLLNQNRRLTGPSLEGPRVPEGGIELADEVGVF